MIDRFRCRGGGRGRDVGTKTEGRVVVVVVVGRRRRRRIGTKALKVTPFRTTRRIRDNVFRSERRSWIE